jgi:hypothetical protein
VVGRLLGAVDAEMLLMSMEFVMSLRARTVTTMLMMRLTRVVGLVRTKIYQIEL